TFYGDLLRLENNTVTEEFTLDDFITNICDDGNGNLWVGTIKNGLFRLDGDRNLIDYSNEQPIKLIMALYNDTGNKLWIGTRKGLYTYHQKEGFKSYPDVKKLPTDSLQFITGDGKGNIWLGSFDGLFKIEKGIINDENIHTFITGLSISFMMEDSEGTVWVGTPGLGLLMQKEKGYFVFE
ncbi:MAG: hypothetical protein GY757_08350, partial [bacterium]|nr:hypothetical protein [bacterium]